MITEMIKKSIQLHFSYVQKNRKMHKNLQYSNDTWYQETNYLINLIINFSSSRI